MVPLPSVGTPFVLWAPSATGLVCRQVYRRKALLGKLVRALKKRGMLAMDKLAIDARLLYHLKRRLIFHFWVPVTWRLRVFVQDTGFLKFHPEAAAGWEQDGNRNGCCPTLVCRCLNLQVLEPTSQMQQQQPQQDKNGGSQSSFEMHSSSSGACPQWRKVKDPSLGSICTNVQ